jgi:hypothetical protein
MLRSTFIYPLLLNYSERLPHEGGLEHKSQSVRRLYARLSPYLSEAR